MKLTLKYAGLFRNVWPFVGTKGLRELNICETKNYEIKVYELDLDNWKKCGKIANEQVFISFTCLFKDFISGFYFGIKSRKIEHTFDYNRKFC